MPPRSEPPPYREAGRGFIAPDYLYTADELRRRLGLGINSIRRAKRHGLKVTRIGKRDCVLGRDLIKHFGAG